MSSTQLDFNVNGENLTAPLAFEDIRLIDLSDDYAASDSSGSDVRLTKGFFFKSETSGLFNAITLYQWKKGLAAYTGTISNPISDVQRNSVLQFIRDNGEVQVNKGNGNQVADKPEGNHKGEYAYG